MFVRLQLHGSWRGALRTVRREDAEKENKLKNGACMKGFVCHNSSFLAYGSAALFQHGGRPGRWHSNTL
ncbi:hypothetical protein I7I48_09296 [Histoplasma ohiense]|nr:hypothetical protein I7I48_09296 [Histoplasma ohiense (nom. inval.)]